MQTSPHRPRWVLLVAAIALSGCVAEFYVARYSIAASNVEAFRASGDRKIGVAAFTAAEEGSRAEVSCRGSAMMTPAHETYAAYIQRALVDELRVAGLYAANAPTQIKGHLAHIDVNTTKDPHWEISLIVTVGNSQPFALERKYPFLSSFIGTKACELAGQAFLAAVQDLVGALAREPRFVKAL